MSAADQLLGKSKNQATCFLLPRAAIPVAGLAASRAACVAVCLSLAACGNKGDLYLQEIELSDEQKSVLEELGNDLESNPDGVSVDEPEDDIDRQLDELLEDEEDERKKKKSSTTPTPQ